jgi:hypothetical protein
VRKCVSRHSLETKNYNNATIEVNMRGGDCQ